MKKLFFTLFIFVLVLPFDLSAQNEFGSINSFWNYDHFPHDGNGYGWDKVGIVGDTMINGITQKIVSRTFYRKQTLPPLEEISGTQLLGYMYTQNDSVFLNDNLIFDFGMEAGDTIKVIGGLGWSAIGLVVDSVTVINIDGFDYKKYHGQKLCLIDENNVFEYEPFEAIETIGPIGFDFFNWNTDGCLIGGGSNRLVCHNNGNFTYPSDEICEEFLLVNVPYIFNDSQVNIFPNPTRHSLTINHLDKPIFSVEVYNVNGQLVKRKETESPWVDLDLSTLHSGVYYIKIETKAITYFNHFVKM